MAETSISRISLEQPRPRIVQYNKRRYSVRLESVFWRTLEDTAQTRGLPIEQPWESDFVIRLP